MRRKGNLGRNASEGRRTARRRLILVICGALALACGCDRHGGKDDDDERPKSGQTNGAATKPAAKEPDEVKLTPEAIELNGIQIEKTRKHVLVPTFVAAARVAYDQEAMAQVGCPVPGRVTDLRVRLGDTVKKGDDLLTVESSELGEAQSDYLVKRTAVAAAETAVGPAKAAFDRGKALFEGDQSVSAGELQKRDAEYRAAQSAVRSAGAALTAAANRLRLLGMDKPAVERLATTGELTPTYTVRAPIAGKVVVRDTTLGQLVSPDKDVLLVLADVSSLWVVADVPESHLADVAAGAKVKVALAALPAESLEGVVSLVGPELNEATRTVPVRVEVKNDHGLLRPGMFARAEIAAREPGGGGQPVLAVPEEAVLTVNGRSVVFVPDDEENTFKLQPVTVGRAVGGMVPVLAGLKERKEVVTAGGFVLKAELAKGQVDND